MYIYYLAYCSGSDHASEISLAHALLHRQEDLFVHQSTHILGKTARTLRLGSSLLNRCTP